jgi:N-acetylglutamate synthase-like GNAT family acetyltransferase
VPEVGVRDADIEDADALAALEKDISGVFRPEYWLDELSRNSYPPVCLCAERDGELVGLVLGHIRMGEFGFEDDIGWLVNIGVRADARGARVGHQLVDAAIDRFRALGVGRIFSISEDERLLGFMRAAGFSNAGNLQTLTYLTRP